MQRLILQQYDQLRNLWLSVGQCWSFISSSTFLRFRAFVLVSIWAIKPLSHHIQWTNKEKLQTNFYT